MRTQQTQAGPLSVASKPMSDLDLVWRDEPNAWHQQLARIVDHRFSTLDELQRFALAAKRAGVSALSKRLKKHVCMSNASLSAQSAQCCTSH